MIAYLKGQVKSISGLQVVLDVNGVGYLVSCTSATTLGLKLNTEAEIIIHTDVQETSLSLYGFLDTLELQVFKLLISVSGIGAKSAVDILSKIDKVELLKILSREDSVNLKKIKGVGGKTADRLILELKDKVSALIQNSREIQKASGGEFLPQIEEALQALQALGFSAKKSREVLDRISNDLREGADSGEIVRMALGYM